MPLLWLQVSLKIWSAYMRTFLRDIRTGLYFKACGEWTPDPSQALSFKLINTAIKRADRMGLRGIELVVKSPKAENLTTLPVEILDNMGQAFARRHD